MTDEISGEVGMLYQRAYLQIQALLDEALGPEEHDGAGEGIVADVRLALAAAEARGEARGRQWAVEALRDVANEARADAEFWDGKAQDGFAAPEELTRRKVEARRQHEAANHAGTLADYLESLTQPTEEAP